MVQRSRAQRLNGLFPLSYVGVIPTSPPNFVMDDRPPTVNDSKNFYIGDLWLDTSAAPNFTSANIWMLVSLVGNQATWINMCCGETPSDQITIIGDTGGPLVGSAFIFSGGSTGLSFDGAGDTFTLTFAGITANGGTVSLSTDAVAGTVDVGTGAGNKTTTLGSTTASSETILQSDTGAMKALGIAGGSVSNKNYVTVDSVGGQLGSDVGTTSGITITGDTGGPFTSATFTFAGGTTGLSFDGAVNTFTLTFAGITANGGTVSLSTDNLNDSINIGTGAGAKTVTLGSVNTTSTTNLQAGTGGIKIPAFTEGALETDSSGVISSVTGTAGQVLTANTAGTAPSFQTLGAGTKHLIQSQTVSGVTNVDFVTGVTGYSYYILEALSYFFTVNSNQTLEIFYTTNAGGSWNSFTYNQFIQSNESDFAVFRALGINATTAGQLINGFQGTIVNARGSSITKFFGFGAASMNKQTTMSGTDLSNDAINREQLLVATGTNQTGTVNGIRIAQSLAPTLLFSGTFRLFGVV